MWTTWWRGLFKYTPRTLRLIQDAPFCFLQLVDLLKEFWMIFPRRPAFLFAHAASRCQRAWQPLCTAQRFQQLSTFFNFNRFPSVLCKWCIFFLSPACCAANASDNTLTCSLCSAVPNLKCLPSELRLHFVYSTHCVMLWHLTEEKKQINGKKKKKAFASGSRGWRMESSTSI